MNPRLDDFLYQICDFDPQCDDWWELIDLIDDIWIPEDTVRHKMASDYTITLRVNGYEQNKKIIQAINDNPKGLWALTWFSLDRNDVYKFVFKRDWLPDPPVAKKYEQDNIFPTYDGKHAIPQK
jgi:hypothetical protein